MCAQQLTEQRSAMSRVEELLTWLGGGHRRKLAQHHERPAHAEGAGDGAIIRGTATRPIPAWSGIAGRVAVATAPASLQRTKEARAARQVFEEVEEITFSLKRTRKVMVNSESSDARDQPSGRSATTKIPSRAGGFAHSSREDGGRETYLRIAGHAHRSSLPTTRELGDSALESPESDGKRELTARDGPPELRSPEGPRQLPPPE